MPKKDNSNNQADNTSFSSTSSDTGESLFGSQMMNDYKERPSLDEYDQEDITDEEIDDDILYNSLESEEEPTRIVQIKEETNTLSEILTKYLNTKQKEIKNMCTQNLESIYISYIDLEKQISENINQLIKNTESFMAVLNSCLNKIVKELFPNYNYIKNLVHVRITNVPNLEDIRSLRNIHIGTLVKVRGVVTRRSVPMSQPSLVTYRCGKCSSTFGPLVFNADVSRICINCQSKGPHTICSTGTTYKDVQKVTLQEVPGTVPSGRLPRQKEIYLSYDLIDSCKPGDEIEVTGIYTNQVQGNAKINMCNITSNSKFGANKNSVVIENKENASVIFVTIIDAITVEKKDDEVDLKFDIKEITNLAKHPQIKNIILNSIAPSIYGHSNIKRAIALAMFGGQRKENEGHCIRGDINVLLLGDPGTAKSQFLRYIQKTSHRAILATGQGASSVGLTASVRKDTMTKEWTLEGGALVLADKGVCLIDEFDKMNEYDRVSIHEAMEQQSISISKAGIIASLHARCSVIAAANPKRGCYNSNLSFGENVNLTDPIISRFDILCVVKDCVGAGDKLMGEFVLESHMKISSHMKNNKENDNEDETSSIYSIKTDKKGNLCIGQEALKKYIAYARKNCFPALSEVNKEKVAQLYSELRKESMVAGSIPITARHIESLVRMSEAFARIKLRNIVLIEDIDSAIEVALDSFVSAQKYAITKVLRRKFAKFLNTGIEMQIYILNEIFNEKAKLMVKKDNNVKLKDLERRAQSFGCRIENNLFVSDEFTQDFRIEDDKIYKK
ncbi:MCM DNA helicase complex subunit [Binucleata daphniae]